MDIWLMLPDGNVDTQRFIDDKFIPRIGETVTCDNVDFIVKNVKYKVSDYRYHKFENVTIILDNIS